MKTIYQAINEINNYFKTIIGVNPKLIYAAFKAGGFRIQRLVTGRLYGADRNSVNIIVHDTNLLLVSIPKVATRTFIFELLYNRLLGERVEYYSGYVGDLLAGRPELGNYYKVGIVRNPWARVLSVYNSKICHPKIASARPYLIKYPNLHHKMSFQEFVEWLCSSEEGCDDNADRHWLSQYLFLYSGDCLLVDEVIPFEDLGNRFTLLCQSLGYKSVTLGNYSRITTTGGMSYREAYEDQWIEMVSQRYAEDIERFQYQF